MTLAYIDPGLGQLIWLSIVSAFVGFVFYVKKIRAWAVGVWQKSFRRGKKLPDNIMEKTAPGQIEVEAKVEIDSK